MKITSFSILPLFILPLACKEESTTLEQNEAPYVNKILALDSLINAQQLQTDFSGTVVVGNGDSVFFSKAVGTANRV